MRLQEMWTMLQYGWGKKESVKLLHVRLTSKLNLILFSIFYSWAPFVFELIIPSVISGTLTYGVAVFFKRNCFQL